MSCPVRPDSLYNRRAVFSHAKYFKSSSSEIGDTSRIAGANNLAFSNTLCNNTNALKTGHLRTRSIHRYSSPRAVLAMDSGFDITRSFSLDHNLELRATVTPANAGNTWILEVVVTNGDDSLYLHWGGVSDKKEKWVLPSRRPTGTTVYKHRALRSRFSKTGGNASLKVEIDDPSVQAFEFLLYNEAKNKWYKNGDGNFHIDLRNGEELTPGTAVVPEDLVQIQAYLRWERKGKQVYTPEKEKEEYEAARTELSEEIQRGASIGDVRSRLTGRGDEADGKSQHCKSIGLISDDLVQIQAYIRWEKDGKPNYSSDQQLREFEEAKKELQAELDKGISLDELRKKLTKGAIQRKDTEQKQVNVQHIRRKKREHDRLINKHVFDLFEEELPPEQAALTDLEQFARNIEHQNDTSTFNKTIFKLADKQLLVMVAKSGSKTKVNLATDFEGTILLHWALSKVHGEWMAPPSGCLPKGSVSVGNAVETEFRNSSVKLQTLDIEVEDESSYTGIPFVIRTGGGWVKNKGADFYVDFSSVKPKPKVTCESKGTARALLDRIAGMEHEAQKSFMHRFNIAADLLGETKDSGILGVAGLLVWMRFMATRKLVWNRNYNVKPREISRAQDRLMDTLQDVYRSTPQYRELLRMVMSTVGRGGEGDVGQRIRDEILVIQRNNDCKGGMMEEWHQKLHNNTSPDDVIICEALMDYIKSDFNMSVYWETLSSNGISKERLLSYDRAIHSEPSFRGDQKAGLLRDLGKYLRTLKAVHSGADLESAVSNCLGYTSRGEGFMVGVRINMVPGLPSGFPELLQYVVEHVEDKSVEALLEGLLEARQELRPLLLSSSSARFKDVLFLDIALDSTVRTAVERGYSELAAAPPEKIMRFISLVLENVALSADDNEDLVCCLKAWDRAAKGSGKDEDWALFAKSVLDRTRLALAVRAEWFHRLLQPSAEYLGSLLGLQSPAVGTFTEEIIRAGSSASLSLLLNRIDPVLRQAAHLGSWQIISPVEATGRVLVIGDLLSVQQKRFEEPVILIAGRVKGEEEIPDGVVAVLTPDMPDVLSHVSVRARNGKICFATCYDSSVLDDIRAREGTVLHLKPSSSEISYTESVSPVSGVAAPALFAMKLVEKRFGGKHAIPSEEFTTDTVGAKSRNVAYLKNKVPTWIRVPTSVALPFGVFEKVLSDSRNRSVAAGLERSPSLAEARDLVMKLEAPDQLVKELKTVMLGSGMPWPEGRWPRAWTAVKRVWASKWNERACLSVRKVGLDHDKLCMSVLVQEVVDADYAFVVHTTNPSSGDATEIYAEVVKGLGETLVGAYPGRAMSFVCKKTHLESPVLLGYPSKPSGLFVKRDSIIFRSDSNGEDLEGYAGAGLYDSVAMDEEEKRVIDYASDRLVTDREFRRSILSSIGRAGKVIEELYGSPQDVEGVVRDGQIYVVQTRPQM